MYKTCNTRCKPSTTRQFTEDHDDNDDDDYMWKQQRVSVTTADMYEQN